MEITQNEHSILRLKKLYFNQFSFEGSGIQQANSPDQESPKMTVTASISVNDDTSFTAVLSIVVKAKNIYELNCSLTGIFEVEGGLTEKNAFLQDNAIAIMFPYLRSQVTLLTSQPGMKPIIIPALNIQKLLHSGE